MDVNEVASSRVEHDAQHVDMQHLIDCGASFMCALQAACGHCCSKQQLDTLVEHTCVDYTNLECAGFLAQVRP